jgi:hypothetical protein
MTLRFRPEKNASQIVFDITGGDPTLTTMNLSTIPNRPHFIKSATESFNLRTDDIEGARSIPRVVSTPHTSMLDVSDIEGTATKPMVNPNRVAGEIMRVDDIEGSRPRIIRQLGHSHRNVNPVDPQYDLPPIPPPPVACRPFIRDPLRNDDVEGAHPMSLLPTCAPRDIMRVDDILGTKPVQHIREMNRPSSLDVKDINTDGIFKTRRIVDPMNPVYFVFGTEIKAEDFGTAKPPPEPLTDKRLDISDIEGAQADSLTRWYRTFKPPFAVEEEGGRDEEEGPAAILMVPSMTTQGKELELQQRIRDHRGEKIRICENRHLMGKRGTGDPVQGILRKQRENRVGRAPRNTFQ